MTPLDALRSVLRFRHLEAPSRERRLRTAASIGDLRELATRRRVRLRRLPLAAAARFAAAPRLERFVAANVVQALDFIRTGSPPKC